MKILAYLYAEIYHVKEVSCIFLHLYCILFIYIYIVYIIEVSSK